VGRHAQASQLRVGIAVRDCTLTLAVQDDGVGADPLALAAASSYGVQGMRVRAHHFGGQMRIEGAPQQGTTATLSMAWGAASA
jgi:signal transduction histidine kinase